MRSPQAASARPALVALQQKTHAPPQEERGKRPGWQVLTSGSLTMTNPLALPRLFKAPPDYASDFPARRTLKPSLFTRLLGQLRSAMSFTLAGLQLVGEALIEARQMQREMRQRHPYFHE
jgi:hypothetical protein